MLENSPECLCERPFVVQPCCNSDEATGARVIIKLALAEFVRGLRPDRLTGSEVDATLQASEMYGLITARE